MKHNERKIQILSILKEKPLTSKEIRERAGIEEKLLNALAWKYKKRGLIFRASKSPVTWGLTARGRARLMYLTHPIDDHTDTVSIAKRSPPNRR